MTPFTPSPAQLKQLILAKVDSEVSLKTAWDAGSDDGVVSAMTKLQQPGYIPLRHLLSVLLADPSGFGGNVIHYWEFGTVPDESFVLNPQAKQYIAKLKFMAKASDYNFRPMVTLVGPACDAISTPPAIKATILAGEVKIGILQEAFGLDATITASDVAKARVA